LDSAGLDFDVNEGEIMEKKTEPAQQPMPVTPGVTKGMVRQHALKLYRDKLTSGHSLTLEDWVLAEKDLVDTMHAEDLPQR
jgi:hypothetical protein